jgi:hypothetical protein
LRIHIRQERACKKQNQREAKDQSRNIFDHSYDNFRKSKM